VTAHHQAQNPAAAWRRNIFLIGLTTRSLPSLVWRGRKRRWVTSTSLRVSLSEGRKNPAKRAQIRVKWWRIKWRKHTEVLTVKDNVMRYWISY